jgi:putative transposase
MKIHEPNLVWSTDLTYIPMIAGFMYLTAVIDWYSRYVLSWEFSNTMGLHPPCRDALESALGRGEPVIFNTDQGSQFTSKEFSR